MADRDDPLISIIVPSFNQGSFIRDTIQSCLDQDYRPIEIIVMDGGSTDNSIEILKSFGEIPELKWVSEPDDGVVDAVNRGLERATGEIAAVQSSDDYYLPGCFSSVIDAFRSNPGAGLVYGNVNRVDVDGNPTGALRLPGFSMKRLLSRELTILQPAAFFRRELGLKLGGWNPDIPYVPDTDFWFRLAFHSQTVQCARPLAVCRTHPDQRDTNTSRIFSDYLRMLDLSEELKQASPRLQRAAQAGAEMLKFRYGGPWTDRDLTNATWKAVCCRPSLLLSPSLQKHRLCPGYFRLAAFIGRARRAVHRHGLFWLCLVVALSRLPWIATGYGTDPDSHRVVLAARHIASGGGYEASRLPGNPVHEGLTSLIVNFGPAASNGLSVVFSICGALWLALLARRLGARNSLLLAAAFAFCPVVYIASVCTIDYVWAASMILGGVYCAVRKRPVWSGLLTGLAIGCRITSGMIVLPLAWYWVFRRQDSARLRNGLVFIAVCAVAGALCYLPGLHRYGLSLLSFYENGYPPLRDVIINGTVGVWGTLGALAFVAPIAGLYPGMKRARNRLAGNVQGEFVVCGIATALWLLAYFRLPHEAGYLIPLVPFVLLLIGRMVPQKLSAAFFLLVVLSPFVTVGRTGIHPGQIFQDHKNRREQARCTTALIKAVAREETTVAIIAGEDLPCIQTELRSDRQGMHRYIYLVESLREYGDLSRDGTRVFVLPRARLSNVANYDIDVAQYGAVPLNWAQLVDTERLDPLVEGEEQR